MEPDAFSLDSGIDSMNQSVHRIFSATHNDYLFAKFLSSAQQNSADRGDDDDDEDADDGHDSPEDSDDEDVEVRRAFYWLTGEDRDADDRELRNGDSVGIVMKSGESTGIDRDDNDCVFDQQQQLRSLADDDRVSGGTGAGDSTSSAASAVFVGQRFDQMQISPRLEGGPVVGGGGGGGGGEADSEHQLHLPIRRSASLRTFKTPPITPREKKAVKFADSIGLDLQSVRTFLENHRAKPRASRRRRERAKFLEACFDMPGDKPNFLDRVYHQKVCLENAQVSTGLSLTGIIRVANQCFDKEVFLRWSTDDWTTQQETPADHLENLGDTDKFHFQLELSSASALVGQRLELVVGFRSGPATAAADLYWDSNLNFNYVFEVCRKSCGGSRKARSHTQ